MSTEREKHLSRVKRTLENPLHVLDLRDGKRKIICRDGYYPPEVLNKLVNLEIPPRKR